MLKCAFSKLKLEHVVIGKGQFKQERSKDGTDVLTVSAVSVTSSCNYLAALSRTNHNHVVVGV